MADINELVLSTIGTIHSCINQLSIPTGRRLSLIVDNTKFLLSIAPLDKNLKKTLWEDLEAAENTLSNLENVKTNDEIITYAQIQSNIEKEIKKKEKYIIDTCLSIVSTVIDATKGQVLWE